MKPRRTRLWAAAVAAALLLGTPACGRSGGRGAAEDAAAPREHDHREDEREGHGHRAEHADEVTLSAEAAAHYRVRVEPIVRRHLVETIAVPARVAFNADATAHVGTPVEGRVAEVRAHRGDAVREGDPLLVIDSPALGEAQSDFLQKRAAVTVARAAFEVARSAFERAKELSEGKGISRGEALRREGEFKGAGGALAAAESAALTAENKLHLYGMTGAEVKTLARSGEIRPRYVVRAPIAGAVVEREPTLGEVVGPEREKLCVIADLSVLWVLADVPENRAAEVRPGAGARITGSALGERAIAAEVSFVASALDPAARTLEARIAVRDGGAGLKPGMFVQAEIEAARGAADAPEALAVPEDAVQTVEGAPSVFVAVRGEENTFARRAVTVGPAVGRMAPILAGLAEGEPVVVSGAFILKAELAKESAEHAH